MSGFDLEAAVISAPGLSPTNLSLARRFQAWSGKKFTFMIVPHSDRRVLNFQINALVVAMIGGLVLGLILTFLAMVTLFSGTEQHIVEKASSLRSARTNLESVLDQVNGLMKIYQDFQGTMTGTLKEMNLNTGSTHGAAVNGGDLARIANAQEMSSNEVRQVLDIKKLARALGDAIVPLNEISRVWKTQKQLLSDIPNVWPVVGGRSAIFMRFGPNLHPLRNEWFIHQGVDIQGATGLFVVASANGKVTDVHYDLSNGNGEMVEIEHKYGFRTRYANLGTCFVQPGDEVYQGQRIGSVGATGVSTGPHLHFEILLGTQILDPASFLKISTDIDRL